MNGRSVMLKWIKKMLRPERRQAEETRLEPSPMEADNAVHGLETRNRALAQPSAGGAGPDSPGQPAAEGGAEHGVRGGAGGPAHPGAGTRPPPAATRYLNTALGVLSYAELAPHLARNVLALEKHIEDGEFGPAALDDALLLRFHSMICGDLVPQLAGWGRTNVGCEALSVDCRRMGRDADGYESYTRGVLRLLDHYGPFRLACLEALLRAADGRASKDVAQ